jgi:hypothetical protein
MKQLFPVTITHKVSPTCILLFGSVCFSGAWATASLNAEGRNQSCGCGSNGSLSKGEHLSKEKGLQKWQDQEELSHELNSVLRANGQKKTFRSEKLQGRCELAKDCWNCILVKMLCPNKSTEGSMSTLGILRSQKDHVPGIGLLYPTVRTTAEVL